MSIVVRILSVALSGAILVLLTSRVGADVRDCRPGETRDISVVEAPHPPYPRAAVLFCISGHASFEFTIGTDGTTRAVKPVGGEPEGVFDDAGQIIRSWRFEPACEDGKAVPRTATQTIEFNLSFTDSAHCPENLPDDLLEALIMITTLQTEVSRMINSETSALERLALEPTLPPPYAEIERAYRKFYSGQIERERAWRANSWVQVQLLFNPAAMKTDGWSGLAEEALEQWIAGRIQIREQWPEMARAFQDDLRALTDLPDLDPLARRLLLDNMIAGLDGEYAVHDEVAAIESALYDHYRDLIQWFAERQQDWAIEGGEMRFASDALEAEYDRRRSEITVLQRDWHTRYSLPNRIYWSAMK